MPKTNNNSLDFLLNIGTIDDILADADNGIGCEPFPFNTHIHLPPNFSAFTTVSQAVELAASEGLGVLGAGNYYNFNPYREFASRAAQKGIFPLFGTEIIALETDLQKKAIRVNDPANPGKYYICGKAISRFDNLSVRGKQLLDTIVSNDTLRMRAMAEKLAEVFRDGGVDTGLDDRAIVSRVVARYGCSPEDVTLQERHLAQAFQEVFFELVPVDMRAGVLRAVFGCESKAIDKAVALQNEIRSYLMKSGKSCYVPETFVDLATAKELIGELGGIACYPTLVDGAGSRCEYEYPLETYIANLKSDGYSMAEFIPLRNSPEILAEYVTAVRKAGIVVVAGTEHNTLDMVPLVPTCLNSQPIPQEVEAIFWEGTCVLIAHQFLSAHGQCGLVDHRNIPNAKYIDNESRIQAMAKIGAAVLRCFMSSAVPG